MGVTAALQRAGLGPPSGPARAVVLGGGGAARAAAIALKDMGFGVTIMTRSLDGVREFASRHGFRLASLSAAVLEREEPRAVVHATPVGSAQRGVESPRLLPDWTPQRGVFVLDMGRNLRLTGSFHWTSSPNRASLCADERTGSFHDLVPPRSQSSRGLGQWERRATGAVPRPWRF